jgi:MinD superfamily P-loop ATPase
VTNLKLTVLSGKGGTGKTTVSVNMALSLPNIQLLDADVEEPNSQYFLHPNFDKEENVFRKVPEINQSKCTACRQCVDFCEYNALAMMIDEVLVFPEICHSCGGCEKICPENAITEVDRVLGVLKHATTEYDVDFWQGELNIGEESSVPVIEALKEKTDNQKDIIIDAQPGTTCPTIEAVVDSDYGILVTEPTPFGLSDLKLASELMDELEIPYGVIINRAEEDSDEIIEEFCQEKGIDILLKIPFKREFAHLYSDGIPFVADYPEWKDKFKTVFEQIRGVIDGKNYSN